MTNLEIAYKILWKSEETFSPRLEDIQSECLDPETLLILQEEINKPELSKKAKTLMSFCLRKAEDFEEVEPQSLMELAKKELKWTRDKIREAKREVRMYLRSLSR